jgi:hypothetical protein
MFTERLGLKATALALAILLWFIVAARQPTESYVSVRVVPELDSSLVMVGGPPPLRALVAARAADIVKLYASPLVVRRRIDASAPDTLMLDVTPADVRVPPELTGAVRVLDVDPHSVMVRFAAGASRRVPVRGDARIVVQRDTALISRYSLHFEPETVRITGPRGAVRGVRIIRPVPLTIVGGDTLPHLVDLDTVGLGVRVHPAQVKVKAYVECRSGDRGTCPDR